MNKSMRMSLLALATIILISTIISATTPTITPILNATACSMPMCQGAYTTNNTDEKGCAIYACPLTSKEVRINQEFSLETQQTAIITDYKQAQIKYLAPQTACPVCPTQTTERNETCPACETKAQIQISLSQGNVQGNVSTGRDITMKVGEKTDFFGATLVFIKIEGYTTWFKIELSSASCQKPICVGAYNTSRVDENGCIIYGCPTNTTTESDPLSCLNNPTNWWDQETDTCKEGFNESLIRNSCSDSDGGKNSFKYAHTFGFRSSYADDKDKRIRTGGADACSSEKQGLEAKRVLEHYCDEKGYIQTTYINCVNSCVNSTCIKVEINPTNETGPIQIPSENATISNVKQNESAFICGGCMRDTKCYPLGYRKAGEYCSENFSFLEQFKAEAFCENNFECSSNVCISGKCVSHGLIESILNWFKRLFDK